ncbi:MAG: hypothetical protein ABIE22_05465 [archaeon]
MNWKRGLIIGIIGTILFTLFNSFLIPYFIQGVISGLIYYGLAYSSLAILILIANHFYFKKSSSENRLKESLKIGIFFALLALLINLAILLKDYQAILNLYFFFGLVEIIILSVIYGAAS